MANLKISELTAATAANSADLIAIAQGGVTKKLTVGNLFISIPSAVSGTVDKVAKFTSTTGVGDSNITDTGTNITIAAGTGGDVSLTAGDDVILAPTDDVLINPGDDISMSCVDLSITTTEDMAISCTLDTTYDVRNFTMTSTGDIVFTGGTGKNIFLKSNDTQVLTLNSTIAANETIMTISYNNGVIGSGRVTIGAVDSGGAGYRLLRVPN